MIDIRFLSLIGICSTTRDVNWKLHVLYFHQVLQTDSLQHHCDNCVDKTVF